MDTPNCFPISDHYQVSLAKVIGTDDVHRDQVMMLESQLSELMDKCGWCCLAQDLIHLSMQSLTHQRDKTTHQVKPDTWGKARPDHENVVFTSMARVVCIQQQQNMTN